MGCGPIVWFLAWAGLCVGKVAGFPLAPGSPNGFNAYDNPLSFIRSSSNNNNNVVPRHVPTDHHPRTTTQAKRNNDRQVLYELYKIKNDLQNKEKLFRMKLGKDEEDLDDMEGAPTSLRDLPDLPSKRQNGWYNHYGKRGLSEPPQTIPLHPRLLLDLNALPLVISGGQDNSRSTPFRIAYSPSKSEISKILKLALDSGLELREDHSAASGKEDIQNGSDDKGESFVDQSESSPEMSKRQQGWFISYGKRSARSLYDSQNASS